MNEKHGFIKSLLVAIIGGAVVVVLQLSGSLNPIIEWVKNIIQGDSTPAPITTDVPSSVIQSTYSLSSSTVTPSSSSSSYSSSNDLYGLAIKKLATRTGPSYYDYPDGGTFEVAGEYIRVLSRSYNKRDEIWWIKCEIPTKDGGYVVRWTGYQRFDSSSLPLNSIPIE